MLNSIALMNGITNKMDYLQVRQRVLAQNISNADSPGYQAKDVQAPDFRSTMARYINKNSLQSGQKLSMTLTSPMHGNRIQLLDRAETGDRVRQPYEVKPAKNGVTMEEQMMNAASTAVDYQLVTNVYSKNLDMLRSAIK